MKKDSIKINGMSCSHCVKAVEDKLLKLPLRYYTVTIGEAVAEYDEADISIDDIKKAIIDAGYEPFEIVKIV